MSTKAYHIVVEKLNSVLVRGWHTFPVWRKVDVWKRTSWTQNSQFTFLRSMNTSDRVSAAHSFEKADMSPLSHHS